ncbi:MAG: DUF2828 family protein [Bacilli bacterium]
MSNNFLNGLSNATNFTYTENGAVTHKTTKSDLLDMFAMGAAMRNRSDSDVILMFRKAYTENPVYALKCLFYIRDVRGGQGERRFFRVVMKDLASWDTEAALRNLRYVPEFGRWDDLYVFVGTPLESAAFNLMKEQLALDMDCKTPSLLAKWMKSENTSSNESRRLANITRKAMGMTHKQYRKTLSVLRARINVLERLMSENRWDEIEFDKIPSKAGMIYKNAFARHDLQRANSEKNVQTYEEFAKDTTKKVNAKTLYPYECVHEAVNAVCGYCTADEVNRLMVNKYWDNLEDYFKGASLNALAVVDTSGSMRGTPIEVAISLGMYCAEKAQGPFAGHYVSFSSRPQLIRVEGTDFCDKVQRIWKTNLCENTNIEATFDLLLNTAIANRCSQDELPQNIIVISDMEFDMARGCYWYSTRETVSKETLMEGISRKWAEAGYKMPHLIFWNVDARQNNIPMIGNGPISFVSGFSPSIFQTIMTGKTGYELMMETLNKERYAEIS